MQFLKFSQFTGEIQKESVGVNLIRRIYFNLRETTHLKWKGKF